MPPDDRRRSPLVGLCIVVAVVVLVLSGTVAAAAQDEQHDDETSDVCEFDTPEWRDAQTIAGVDVAADPSCRPDNPYRVAAATNGTNNVPMGVLMESGLARDAVRKHSDEDGDGDPDVIEITVEVHGVNEFNETDARHAIAPGVEPAFWVFAPKTRGVVQEGFGAAIRMPSTPIRVEQGDTVRVTVENTHYFPHALALQGVDQPRPVDESDDAVTQASEDPIMPGDSRTYEIEPRQPGTRFYDSDVGSPVHSSMGLGGLFVVEADRPDNRVQTFNVGAGRVRHPSAAVAETHDGEFDLQYQEVDADLHAIPQSVDDPRRVARAMNRNYDPGEADPDYFLLNGRSFPYTVRESLLAVEPNSTYRLRTLNAGSETVSLHSHGHEMRIEAPDGGAVDDGQAITRDVVSLTAGQRLDLTLNTTDDGLHSDGDADAIWFLHDHREAAVTNDGIWPGGTITMIAYESHLQANGVPETNRDLSRFFDETYYAGEVPVWGHLDPDRLGEAPGNGTSDDGQRQGEGQGATESGFPEQGDTPSGEETDAVGGTTMPLIGAFVTGLLVVARRRRGGVEQ